MWRAHWASISLRLPLPSQPSSSAKWSRELYYWTLLLCSGIRNEGAGGYQWAAAIFHTCAFRLCFTCACKVLFSSTCITGTWPPGRGTATRGHLKDIRSVGSRCLGRRWTSHASVSLCAKLWHAARALVSAPFSFCLSAVASGYSELVVCRKHGIGSFHGWTAANGQQLRRSNAAK